MLLVTENIALNIQNKILIRNMVHGSLIKRYMAPFADSVWMAREGEAPLTLLALYLIFMA